MRAIGMPKSYICKICNKTTNDCSKSFNNMDKHICVFVVNPALEEAEGKYMEAMDKQREEDEKHYQYLADNQQESYEDWLNSEYGDDAEAAYWNNE